MDRPRGPEAAPWPPASPRPTPRFAAHRPRRTTPSTADARGGLGSPGESALLVVPGGLSRGSVDVDVSLPRVGVTSEDHPATLGRTGTDGPLGSSARVRRARGVFGPYPGDLRDLARKSYRNRETPRDGGWVGAGARGGSGTLAAGGGPRGPGGRAWGAGREPSPTPPPGPRPAPEAPAGNRARAPVAPGAPGTRRPTALIFSARTRGRQADERPPRRTPGRPGPGGEGRRGRRTGCGRARDGWSRR